MHEALITIANMIALAHDHWRATAGRRRPLAGKVAVLEEQAQRLRAECALLRARMQRVPPMRRPHYRQDERLEILWHAARYRMSIADTAAAFCVTRQTITNWRRDLKRDAPRSLPRIGTLSELVSELVLRLKAEWPDWGTRRIAGQIARLGVKVSRSSVQRIVRRGPRDPVEPEQAVTGPHGRVLLAKRPGHIRMIDFTRIGGVVRPVWVGAVIDAYSRRVLAIASIRGAPTAAFAIRLLRRAMRQNGFPRWLVSDKDPVLRARTVQRLLTQHGILRRYGAIGRSGSISLNEQVWRSMKEEYVRPLSSTARRQPSTAGWSAIGAGSIRNVRVKGNVSAHRTTCTSLDPRSRRETSLAACCTSGSTMEIDGSRSCVFATLRRSSHFGRATAPEVRSSNADASTSCASAASGHAREALSRER